MGQTSGPYKSFLLLLERDNTSVKDLTDEILKGRTTTIATAGSNDIGWSSELNIELLAGVTMLELDLDGLVHFVSFFWLDLVFSYVFQHDELYQKA